MGFCRFEGCQAATNLDYSVFLPDQNLELYICGLWGHYAKEHNVLPPARVREAVLAANPNLAKSESIAWRGEPGPERLSIYFVETQGDAFNHQIGDSPDIGFINKLEQILDGIQPIVFNH